MTANKPGENVRGNFSRPVQLQVLGRPSWQRGAAIAKAFARSLNKMGSPDGLRAMVQQGNGLWRPASRIYAAWHAARAILEPTLREGRLSRSIGAGVLMDPVSVRRFNRFAQTNPVIFGLTDGGRPLGVPTILDRDDARPIVVQMLWEFIESPGRDRLRRCLQCGAWFADETKNRRQRWCSSACRDRAWSRAERRKAGHTQYRPKRRPSKSKTPRR